MPANAGRDVKWFQESRMRILEDAIREGVPLLTAFARAGISRATGYRYLKKLPTKYPWTARATTRKCERRSPAPRSGDLLDDLVRRFVGAGIVDAVSAHHIERSVRIKFGGKRYYVAARPRHLDIIHLMTAEILRLARASQK